MTCRRGPGPNPGKHAELALDFIRAQTKLAKGSQKLETRAGERRQDARTWILTQGSCETDYIH